MAKNRDRLEIDEATSRFALATACCFEPEETYNL